MIFYSIRRYHTFYYLPLLSSILSILEDILVCIFILIICITYSHSRLFISLIFATLYSLFVLREVANISAIFQMISLLKNRCIANKIIVLTFPLMFIENSRKIDPISIMNMLLIIMYIYQFLNLISCSVYLSYCKSFLII